jgi:hypothetical protein
MIYKIVLLFLVAIGVLAMFGKLHWLGGKRLASAKCRRCGRYRIGRGPCPCGEGSGRS